MTHPDFRALCADLAERLEYRIDGLLYTDSDYDLIDRTREALAEPQQGAPSDEELIKAYCDARRAFYFETAKGESDQEDRKEATIAGLRAVLASYGAQAVPVAVSERLPGREDLDPNAYCWLWDGSAWERSNTIPMLPEGRCVYTHWLPHWALPLP